jgi:hypothetical protein
MMLFLAQNSPEGQWLWMALLVLSTIGNAALGWKILTGSANKHTIEPNPLSVEVATRLVSKEDLDKVEKECADEDQILHRRVTKAEDEHNKLAREVTAQTTKIDINSVRLVDMDKKLDTLLRRTS